MGLTNLSKQWHSTPLVSVADIGGTGTEEKKSAFIYLTMGILPDYADLRFEITFDMNKTGGEGDVGSWIAIGRAGFQLATSPNTLHPILNTHYVLSNTIGLRRRFLLKPDYVYGEYVATTTDRARFEVYGVGTAETTEWTITNIRGRLLYLPL